TAPVEFKNKIYTGHYVLGKDRPFGADSEDLFEKCPSNDYWIITDGDEIVDDEEIMTRANIALNYGYDLFQKIEINNMREWSKKHKEINNVGFVSELFFGAAKTTIKYCFEVIKAKLGEVIASNLTKYGSKLKSDTLKNIGKKIEKYSDGLKEATNYPETAKDVLKESSKMVQNTVLNKMLYYIAKTVNENDFDFSKIDSPELFKEAMFDMLYTSAKNTEKLAGQLEHIKPPYDVEKINELVARIIIERANGDAALFALGKYYGYDNFFDSATKFLMEFVIRPGFGDEIDFVSEKLFQIDTLFNEILKYCPNEVLDMLINKQGLDKGLCQQANDIIKSLEDAGSAIYNAYLVYPPALAEFEKRYEESIKLYTHFEIECTERAVKSFAKKFEYLQKLEQIENKVSSLVEKEKKFDEKINKIKKIALLIDEYVKEMEKADKNNLKDMIRKDDKKTSEIVDWTSDLKINELAFKNSNAIYLEQNRSYESPRIELFAPSFLVYSVSDIRAGGRPFRLEYFANQDGEVEIWAELLPKTCPTGLSPPFHMIAWQGAKNLIERRPVKRDQKYWIELGTAPKELMSQLSPYINNLSNSINFPCTIDIVYRARLITSNGQAEDMEKVSFQLR
ncbi:MAG: hypothetical protein QW561_04550, partial [Candidatus Aenigmatarchaeota archaeon]